MKNSLKNKLNGAEIFTSQPVVGNVKELWDQILKDYDEIVHIPMSSGLSGFVPNSYDASTRIR